MLGSALTHSHTQCLAGCYLLWSLSFLVFNLLCIDTVCSFHVMTYATSHFCTSTSTTAPQASVPHACMLSGISQYCFAGASAAM